MEEVQAKRILDQSMIKIIDNKEIKISKVTVGTFMGGQSWNHVINLPLKDLKVSAGRKSAMDYGFPIIFLPDSGESNIMLNSSHPVEIIAEALYVISNKAKREGFVPQESTEEALFEQVVQTYQTTNPKPTLSEEARSYKIRAEDAVRNKLFGEAADFYGQAIKIDPWWPEGHFNRALILADIKILNNAIFEMKRYLRLVPNANNARAAQDKMYIWQSEYDRMSK